MPTTSTRMIPVPRGDVLSMEQLKAIELLYAQGRTQKDISERLGIHRNTVWKHVSDPMFKIDRRSTRDAVKNIHARRLVKSIDKAHDLLDATLTEGDAYKAKAAAGTLKELDQVHAVACDDDRQAGVAVTLPPAESNTLVQAIFAYLDQRDPGAS